MKIAIPYGSGRIELDLPGDINIELVCSNKASSKRKKEIIQKALDNPIGSVPFEKWLTQNSDFLFIINDATRPTPTLKILKELGKRMDLEKARYIIATGAHKEPQNKEIKLIFGELYNEIKSNVIIHNARDYKSLANIGKTEKGTDVLINKEIIEAGAIITIGSVEPHYFAGFTGGRKSFVPGLAGYDTIEQNHKLALKNNALPLSLARNPVHLDLLDAFKRIPPIPIFSIQAVVRDEKDICSVFCGDIHESFLKASEYSRDIFIVSVKEKADIVITVAKPPLDKNLYQAHKAIEHGKFALKDGGILILVAACNDGIGPDNFYKLLSSSIDPEKIIKAAKEDYRLGYHKAARIAELSKKAEICAVSEIEDKILKGMFIKPFDSLREAVNRSMSKKGKGARIFIVTDGGNIIPKAGGKQHKTTYSDF
ncbi:nickel-dependent lactate racemase [candidate division WOR-3 bacterium]|nr:nickel-dependent lactate racemase [candidate division WOR-3 bacterium]